MDIKLISWPTISHWAQVLARLALVIFILVSMALTLYQVSKEFIPTKLVPEQTVNSVDKTMVNSVDPLISRIDKLEKQLEKQEQTIKKLESNLDLAANNYKILEKKSQSHTEAFKRICEYIMVITVDKKIIPRQCLPEYRWIKEEG